VQQHPSNSALLVRQEQAMNTSINSTHIGLRRSPRLRNKVSNEREIPNKTKVQKGSVKRTKTQLPFDPKIKNDPIQLGEALSLFQATGIEIDGQLQLQIEKAIEWEMKPLD
jgi:hypothetical protein